ncbi:hypothetical protein [Klebsiella quasipneumoniae]|uniref:hypothetical protein n=1 Tax=Klebsiella quasipneumoniae TaxID=1463165 RepID=UPI0022CDFD40|nr:hypothetical protein [Klebsiella quasipneumoniae]
MAQITDERLVKILSETQATIMEHNSRCVRGSVEVDARLFESMIMELQVRRKAAEGYKNLNEMEQRAEQAECLIMCLDDLGVPDTEGSESLSLWGRVKIFAEENSKDRAELQERRKADSEPVAEVVSIYGDPEAFGEREIRPLVGIQQMPYGTKLYRHAQPAPTCESITVTDDMAYAFHHALTDSMIGADDVEEIKTGLRAVFANLTAPVVSAEYPDRLPCSVLLEPGLRFGKGIKTSTMLAALARRVVYESDMAALSPEERAEFQAGIEDFKALIAQPAPVAPVCTCPSGNGSLRWPCPVHPGNSPAIPDAARDALEKALAAMEFMGDTLNNLDAVCTEDVELVAPAFDAVRSVLAAAKQEVK